MDNSFHSLLFGAYKPWHDCPIMSCLPYIVFCCYVGFFMSFYSLILGGILMALAHRYRWIESLNNWLCKMVWFIWCIILYMVCTFPGKVLNLLDYLLQESPRPPPPTIDCAVCQDTVKTDLRDAQGLPYYLISYGCGHVFCRDCLQRWLRYRPTCPLCRAQVIRTTYNWNVALELYDERIDDQY